MDNRKMVYSTTVEHLGHLMRDKLEAEGINTLILNQKDSAYNMFGNLELYVMLEDFDKAIKIVDINRD